MLHPDLVDQIRNAREQRPNLRERDLAAAIGLTEAHLLATDAGGAVTRIAADPGRLLPMVTAVGEVMALTRNESAVHERKGAYGEFHAGDHAAMVLGDEIDLRIFPRHWVHGFAVARETGDGVKRSLQVFDAAGDAVHKVHLQGASDVTAFDRLVAALQMPADAPFVLTDRAPVESAVTNPARIDVLRAEWARMTDTHQFLTLTRRLKMNRLGATRAVGAPFAVPLPLTAVSTALERAAAGAVPVMVFVGNAGCIQIHSGLVEQIAPMGPWQNVLDPRFNLHLRADHIAEVWLVSKPTKRGPAISIEAYDAQGALILQLFGKRTESATDTRPWDALTADLAAGVAA